MPEKKNESTETNKDMAESTGSAGNLNVTAGDFSSTSKTGASAQNDAAISMDQAKETARNIVDQAKATAGDAYETVAQKAAATLEEKKAGLTGGLSSVADTVRRMSGTINEGDDQSGVTEYAAQYTETAAKKIDDIARYFETHDLRGITRDVEAYARNNPAVFLGSAFALGILAARFLKSSPPRTASSGNFATGIDHQLPPASKGTGTADVGTRPVGTTKPRDKEFGATPGGTI